MTDAAAAGEPGPEPLGDLHLRHALVALDGSPSASLALAAGVTAARRDNARLTLLVVVPDVGSDAARWVAGVADPRGLQAEADAEAQRIMRDAVARVPADIPVTTVVRHGRPGPEIVAQGDEAGCDAILLGARGVGRVAALFGSVSGYVLQHARTAVFVAHVPLEPGA